MSDWELVTSDHPDPLLAATALIHEELALHFAGNADRDLLLNNLSRMVRHVAEQCPGQCAMDIAAKIIDAVKRGKASGAVH